MEEALKSKQHIGRIILRLLLRLLAFALSTLAVLAVLVLCAILIICRGGSDSARDTFVRSVKETSAVGFLADLFLSSSEIFTLPPHGSALFSSLFSQKNSSPLLHWGRKRDTISYCMNLSRSVPSQAETDDPRGPESPVPYHYHNQERHTDAQH